MIGMANVSASILDTINDVETPIEDGEEGESVNFYARPPKKQKCKISDVWTQFDKTVEINDDGIVVKNADGSDSMVAICKICFQKLSCGNRGGTSHLRRHKESCLNRTATNTGQTIIGVGPSGSIFSFTFNQDRARRETVRYFVREELPFVKVDKPAFHRWITKSFGPQFKPPSRITMRSDLMMIFEEDKAALKALLDTVPGKISFTSDLWTSNQKLGYMCITAHFITKDWKLHKRVISFPWLPSPHTGKYISDAMYCNLLSWNLCGKIGSFTLDNASNNDVAVSRLKNSLFGTDLLSKQLCHICCNAHVMNLIVKVGLKHVDFSLDNIRESVKHVKNSPAKLQKFFENCKSLNMEENRLPVDMPTRWNSTFIMLRDAIPYQKVLDLFFYDSDFPHAPSPEDWNNAIIIRDFFQIFFDSTKLFSGTSYVTSSAFCYQLSRISLLLKKYSNEPGFILMYEDMKDKYDKYWKRVPLLLGLASCMDPRYKFTILELLLDLNYESEPLSDHESETDTVSGPILTVSQKRLNRYKRKLYALFDQYQMKIKVNVPGPNVAVSNTCVVEDMVATLLSQRREASRLTSKSELQQYLDLPIVNVCSEKTFDLLGWWKNEEGIYPVLSALARDLLTVPVTTVPSEAAFSGSERVVTKYRSCLLPETVEALVCLKDWFQAEEGLQDENLVEETMSDVGM